MKINCLALDHKILPIEVREKIAFSGDDAVEFLRQFESRYQIKDVLLLSTCNRTELYILANSGLVGFEILDSILKSWQEERGFRVPVRCAVIHPHEAAVKRLMRVAAGIESQVVGESEILGQIRGAMELSEQAGVSGKVILRLWEKALRCGKRVRSETRLGDGAVSVAYGALRIAKKIHGSLDGLRFLIVGAGEISELVLKNLDGIPNKNITILNRSPERAELLAKRFGGTSRPFEELFDVMRDCDVVISSTSSRNTLIEKAAVAKLVKNRKKSLLLVDLGLPRDIDSGCKDLSQVFLYNLDDLARLIQENLDDRRSAMPDAFEIVNHEAHRFELWLNGLQTEPVLRALRIAMEESCQFELELLKDEVDAETHKRLQVLLRRLVKRVLHKPTKDLKSRGEDLEPSFLENLESLFHLDSDSKGAE